ncbi:MAG: phosphatase PAP2 family protein [Bacteroidia bacterium]
MEERIRLFIREIKLFIKAKFNYEADELPFIVSIIVSAFIFIVGINLFLEIAEELAENDLHVTDNRIASFFISMRSDNLTQIFTLFTRLGDSYSYIIITILIAVFFIIKMKSWKFILQILVVNILAFIINFFLKGYYGRDRPSTNRLIEASYLSFPSGHAMSAAAFYGFLIYLIIRYIKSYWIKVPLTIICCILILLIGFSRIYLGVHYPSDVLAGFISGLFWVTFCIIIFNILDLIRKRKSKRI